MSTNYASDVETAREYYNSEDADNFYYTIWGGEDIHVGLYQSDDEPIRDASRRTVEHMASKLSNLSKDAKVLDMGAGYGGAARYLAKTYGCHVDALNLSEAENERDRQMNKEQGLDHLITVIDASFDDVPADDASYDIIWSQDSILHSADRRKVLEEAKRLLKSGGELIITDPMQADDCPNPDEVLQPILARIHLPSLGSPGFYRETLKELGFEELDWEDHSHQLPRHYGRVRQELVNREDDVRKAGVSEEYAERMKNGLQHWVDGGNKGYLAWGILHFRKR